MLNKIQALLENIYDIRLDISAQDFLVTESQCDAHVKEQVIIVATDDGIDVSLHIDADTITQLAQQDPFESLDQQNLQAFWLAVEGVSHLTYLAWRSERDRCMTALEMELQAEVDKYLATAFLLSQQRKQAPFQLIHFLLFAGSRIDHDQSSELHTRYKTASYFASRYCHVIRSYLDKSIRRSGLTTELRRFFRKNQREKMHYINEAAPRQRDYRPSLYAAS